MREDMTESYLRGLEDDGLYTPSIKSHSVQKIKLHNYYTSLFSRSMKDLWPQHAYIGLYSGAGRAVIEDSGEIVETTATSAVRLEPPFTHYIFVDNDPNSIAALQQRIDAIPGEYQTTFIQKDVRTATGEIIRTMPNFSREKGLLSFCFVDPFAADLDFQVIKELGSRYRMDFLILLMLGRDIRTNFRRYLEDPEDTRIAALIDDPNWREDWKKDGRSLIRFLLQKFDDAMRRIGYIEAEPSDAEPITATGLGVYLYSLVLYSKQPLGKKFWNDTRQGVNPQISMDF